VRLFSSDSKVEALRAVPLFEGLSRKGLETLAKTSEDLDVSAGKVLCREGDIGHEFFVIVEGEAEVTKEGERLAVMGSGDFFGEIALVEHTERGATVTALTPLRFFVLESRAFWALLESSPEIQAAVMRTLAKRLHAADPDALS
jgi:CRP/FNR family cyclic AMP-dependent transcriptional regulator